ncbi:MAG: hypothetical protein WAT79_08065 [Saprospiraceae bacterium]
MRLNLCLLVFILLLSSSATGQAKIGIHAAMSEYMGLQTELSLEASVYKNFSLAIRGSYGLRNSFQYRGGIRYSPRLFGKTRLRLGADFGSYVYRYSLNESFRIHGKIRGLSLGLEQGIGERWAIQAELSNLEYFEDEYKSNISGGIHLGVIYKISK